MWASMLPATSSAAPWPTTTTVSAEHRCIDRRWVYHRRWVYQPQGRDINHRACISTGGTHIDSKADVSTMGQAH